MKAFPKDDRPTEDLLDVWPLDREEGNLYLQFFLFCNKCGYSWDNKGRSRYGERCPGCGATQIFWLTNILPIMKKA